MNSGWLELSRITDNLRGPAQALADAGGCESLVGNRGGHVASPTRPASNGGAGATNCWQEPNVNRLYSYLGMGRNLGGERTHHRPRDKRGRGGARARATRLHKFAHEHGDRIRSTLRCR